MFTRNFSTSYRNSVESIVKKMIWMHLYDFYDKNLQHFNKNWDLLQLVHFVRFPLTIFGKNRQIMQPIHHFHYNFCCFSTCMKKEKKWVCVHVFVYTRQQNRYFDRYCCFVFLVGSAATTGVAAVAVVPAMI